MITQTQKLKAKTFMGLLAAEGQVPGATSATEIPEEFFNIVDREIADIKAEGTDFFGLMVEAGQMNAVVKKQSKPLSNIIALPKLRITRPYHLGGEMPHAA